MTEISTQALQNTEPSVIYFNKPPGEEKALQSMIYKVVSPQNVTKIGFRSY
jgi:hypothetical protein